MGGECVTVVIVMSLLLFLGIVFTIVHGDISSIVPGILIVATALLPVVLLGEQVAGHVGVAPAALAVTSYGAVLVVGVVVVGSGPNGRRKDLNIWLPFILWLGVCGLFVWADSDVVWSGVFNYLSAPAAWVIGVWAARSPLGASRLVRVVLMVICAQALVVCLQRAGFSINEMSAGQQRLMGDRTNGLLGHPNDLGKVMVLLSAILLTAVGSLTGARRRLCVAGIVVAGLLIVSTEGRAVLFAYVAMIVTWVLLQPRSTGGGSKKFMVLGSVVVGMLFSAGVLMERFSEDARGDSRAALLDVALTQIQATPWFGVGPNSYVAVVGLADSLTASGVPVHNAFLLGAAELGIVGVILLCLPLLMASVKMSAVRRSVSTQGQFARVGLALIPAIVLMGVTGWGLLGGYVLPLLFLTGGWCFGGSTLSSTPVGGAVAQTGTAGADMRSLMGR